MVNTLRRFSQPIMVVITVLVIISFAYWGPSLTRSGPGDGVAMTLYGRNYTLEALKRQANKVHIFAALSERGSMMMGEYAQTVPGAIAIGGGMDYQIIQNSFIFEREADALGITSTEKERIEQLERTPRFLDENRQFDPARVKAFQERELNPRGFTEADLDGIFLHGEVRARKLRALVGSTIAVTPEEVREIVVARNLTTEASYIAINTADFKKDLKATDEEILKHFNDNQAQYKTPEKRRVRFAAFRLPEPADGKPLEPSKSNELLQQAANKAYDLRQELENANADFDALAKKFGAEIGETKDAFAEDEPPDEIETDNDAIGEAAFKLTEAKPYSDHLTQSQGMKKGAYVLKLVETKKPEQRPLEEVKKEIEAVVIGKKADDLAKAKATEWRPKIEEAKKAGKTFYEAAESLGLKAVPHPLIGGMQRQPPGEFTGVVRSEAAKLAPGQLSQPVSGGTAWLIVHVDYRPPVDEKTIAEGRESAIHMLEEGFGPQMPGKRDAVYMDWFTERAIAAGAGKKP
jgi:PPIC-type PPIASE domain/SurA N-terminal domain